MQHFPIPFYFSYRLFFSLQKILYLRRCRCAVGGLVFCGCDVIQPYIAMWAMLEFDRTSSRLVDAADIADMLLTCPIVIRTYFNLRAFPWIPAENLGFFSPMLMVFLICWKMDDAWFNINLFIIFSIYLHLVCVPMNKHRFLLVVTRRQEGNFDWRGPVVCLW